MHAAHPSANGYHLGTDVLQWHTEQGGLAGLKIEEINRASGTLHHSQFGDSNLLWRTRRTRGVQRDGRTIVEPLRLKISNISVEKSIFASAPIEPLSLDT